MLEFDLDGGSQGINPTISLRQSRKRHSAKSRSSWAKDAIPKAFLYAQHALMTAEGVGSMKQRLVVKRSPGIAKLTNSFTVPEPRSPVCSRIHSSPSGEVGSISFHRKIGPFVFKCVIENAPFSCVVVIPFNGLSLLTKTHTASAAMVIWMIFFFVADSRAFFLRCSALLKQRRSRIRLQ